MQNSVDSLHRELSTSQKDKETRPSMWLYAAIMVGVLIIWKGAGWCWKWVTTRYNVFSKK